MSSSTKNLLTQMLTPMPLSEQQLRIRQIVGWLSRHFEKSCKIAAENSVTPEQRLAKAEKFINSLIPKPVEEAKELEIEAVNDASAIGDADEVKDAPATNKKPAPLKIRPFSRHGTSVFLGQVYETAAALQMPRTFTQALKKVLPQCEYGNLVGFLKIEIKKQSDQLADLIKTGDSLRTAIARAAGKGSTELKELQLETNNVSQQEATKTLESLVSRLRAAAVEPYVNSSPLFPEKLLADFLKGVEPFSDAKVNEIFHFV